MRNKRKIDIMQNKKIRKKWLNCPKDSYSSLCFLLFWNQNHCINKNVLDFWRFGDFLVTAIKDWKASETSEIKFTSCLYSVQFNKAQSSFVHSLYRALRMVVAGNCHLHPNFNLVRPDRFGSMKWFKNVF